MKKVLFYLMSLIMVFSFVSCEVENDTNIFPLGYWQPYTTNSNGQYVIGGYVNGQQTKGVRTKAALPGGTYSDFALYSWTADSVIMDGYHGVFQGNTWGYNEAVKYFDNDEDEYSFIGVIPQSAIQIFNATTNEVAVEDLVSFVTDDAGAQTGTQLGTYADDREFLYAGTTVQADHYGEGATLSFKHGNVKVYLKFTSDNANTQIVDFTPYNPGIPAIPEQKDTVDTWISLNRSTNATGSATKTRVNNGGTWGDYTNAYELPANLVAEIKSYYSIDGGTPGDYDLHMGASVWPSGTLKQLRVVKAIPSQYKITAELYNTGVTMDFFDGFKYLKDNGYDIQPANSGGKPDVWNYILLDAFVNGSAYTVVGFNYGASSSVPEYTINIIPEQPAIPATGITNMILLPATSVIGDGTDAVLASYPQTVNATVGLNDVIYSEQTNAVEVVYTIPTAPQAFTSASTRVASPTTWYTFPAVANSVANVGFTVKFSYTYDGVLTKYDNRVFIPASECQWEEGKYYTYIINIRGKGNGKTDPADADSDDPVVPQTNEITVTTVIVDYQTGQSHEHTIK